MLRSKLVFPHTASIPHSLPIHNPLTVLLSKSLSQAETRGQAAGAGAAVIKSPHARPTSAPSNPLAALPTGGIMGPPAAHGLRTTSSPLQARGALGKSEGAIGFTGALRWWLRPTQPCQREGLEGGEGARGRGGRGRCHDVRGIRLRARISLRRETRADGCRCYIMIGNVYSFSLVVNVCKDGLVP